MTARAPILSKGSVDSTVRIIPIPRYHLKIEGWTVLSKQCMVGYPQTIS